MEENSLAAKLAAKGLAGVTPEVNLKECVICMPLPSMNKAAHSGFERGNSGPTKRTYVLLKICKKKGKTFMYGLNKNSKSSIYLSNRTEFSVMFC